MPSVDVDVQGDAGAPPEFEVSRPKITTGTKEVGIEVPTMAVEIPLENDNE